jgi:glutamyl-Q tRNA(Asp) synthetase
VPCRGRNGRRYTGRFAPSPTGDLHLGSLYAAVASYLDARANGGRWLIRMEDLDAPRVVPGSAARILETLRRFGFEWDEQVLCQSDRTDRYAAALATLHERGLTFECSCSRSQLADEERYPGHCRVKLSSPAAGATATRVRVESGATWFDDRIQGRFRQDIAAAVGDFVIRRRDGFIAYVLAVVVDDAAQGVTHVVRGADLLDVTPRQIYLQRLLGLATPAYAHVPVLTESDGHKLAKSARSVALPEGVVVPSLLRIFELLDLSPPAELSGAPLAQVWRWGMRAWRVDQVPRRLALALDR